MLIDWPPHYIIRRSKRALRVSLRVSVQHGLEVVLPYNYRPLNTISTLLISHRPWIEKQLIKVRQLTLPEKELPTRINLSAIHQCYTVDYVQTTSKLQLIEKAGRGLTLLGKSAAPEACYAIFKDWLFAKAKQELPNLLHQYSKQYHLPFSRVAIKRHKGRWGSCTSKKSINLNYQLLLLPSELTAYVLIHELCHTLELNHSPKFWQLVNQLDPNWQQHRHALKAYQKLLPTWVWNE